MNTLPTLYADFPALLRDADRPEFFSAGYTPESDAEDASLSERLLFTQSNARVLLGQDTLGRLHFLAAPHERDYPLPTSAIDRRHHITAHHGMYRQTDMSLLLGKLRYELRLDDGRILPCAAEGATTRYLDHYLPLTETVHDGLELAVVSVAPVLEPGSPAGLAPLPLPGPSGAVYAMQVKNTSRETVRGQVLLRLDDRFMVQYEHSGSPAEERALEPHHREVDRGLLLLWRPDACAGIQMLGGEWAREGGTYHAAAGLELAPGESVLIETCVAVSPEADGIRESLAVLYAHPVLSWINLTSAFWRERLGRLEASAPDHAGTVRASVELHIRSMLDNFNCVQTAPDGRVLIHWQGAPSHNFGRMWGIDVEPTGVSLMHILPPLGLKILEYMADRNTPRWSPYPDHSTPILVAPLILAGKYLDYTGDEAYFRQNNHLSRRLEEIVDSLLACRHPEKALFSSRFSSDGLVMRRYDHGTNVKAYCAVAAWGKMLRALGRDSEPVEALLRQMESDMALMEADGPFGRQISGGVNLGGREDFYMRDDLLYYDGEDSASCMAPVYGLYGCGHEPWRNYHRFARSLFCQNYDPEMDTLRWFPYGGALDGTAYVSQAGGAVTRSEMAAALENLLEKSTDYTGSLYWWPLGKNRRRRVARCSQGQGAWVWQYLQQWLGIRVDGVGRSLTLAPLGLPTEFRWENAVLGAFRFDFAYREAGGKAHVRIRSRNDIPFTVRVLLRPAGAGCEAEPAYRTESELPPGGVLELEEPVPAFTGESVSIIGREAELLGQDGVVFGHYGYHLPPLETSRENVVLLRYVVVNGGELPIHNAAVTLRLPEGMRAQAKPPALWAHPDSLTRSTATAAAESIPPMSRRVFPFWLELCDADMNAGNVWFDGCPFTYPREAFPPRLLIESRRELPDTAIAAELTADDLPARSCATAVGFVSREALLQRATEVFGALNP